MTEADVQDTDSADLRHSLAAMLSAQGDGPPLWRDLRLFSADAMIGFDGRGCMLLRLRTSNMREAVVVELAPDEARRLGQRLIADADAVKAIETPN